MPIYEYRCNDCGHEAEVLQKITEAPITDCPKCNRPSMVKLISAAGFQLKGTGWYATDFRNGSGSSKPKEANGGKPDAAGANGASGDSKAAAAEGPTSTGSGSSTGCGSGGCACH